MLIFADLYVKNLLQTFITLHFIPAILHLVKNVFLFFNLISNI